MFWPPAATTFSVGGAAAGKDSARAANAVAAIAMDGRKRMGNLLGFTCRNGLVMANGAETQCGGECDGAAAPCAGNTSSAARGTTKAADAPSASRCGA